MTTQIRLKVLPRFPSSVVGDTGIVVTRSGQTYTFSLDLSAIPIVPSPTIITATQSIATTDSIVQTNQSGAIVLTVPGSDSWQQQNGRFGIPLTIMDISGTASTNNVTLNFTGGQTASGLSSLVIGSDYGVFRLMPKSGGGWVVT